MRPLWHQHGLKATPLAPKLASKPPLWHQKWPMKPHCSQPASPTKPSRLLKAWCQGFKISKLLRARGRRVAKVWIPTSEIFPVRPPGDPKMCQNCRTVSNFTVLALPGTCLGSMWPPWLPHGAKCDPFGAPKPPLGEPNGRHSDPLGCP